jgi:hypothetical protein
MATAFEAAVSASKTGSAWFTWVLGPAIIGIWLLSYLVSLLVSKSDTISATEKTNAAESATFFYNTLIPVAVGSGLLAVAHAK